LPSEAPTASEKISGRCYCGTQVFRADGLPKIVAYCHFADCRRVTGAPVAAFAAFDPAEVTFEPARGTGISVSPGVQRWFCGQCGSPPAATYDYLPDQIYIPLGVIDQADELPPALHAHAENALSWLQLQDDLPRTTGSSRDALNAAGSDG